MILWLSPMDGITDCAYRLICQDVFDRHGDPDHVLWTWTEFMNADGYIHNPTRLIHHLMKTPEERHLILQIYGGNRDMLLRCTQDVHKKYIGFAWLELNIGCPSPRVMSCGGGSGMLRDKQETLETIRLLSQETDMPFSIKTRAGLTTYDQEEQYEFILQAAQYCHMIAIHGRTYKQSHAWDVNREFIYRVKKTLWDKCLILWNGGIKSYEQSLALGQWSKINNLLDGVMIGQAAIARPWIFTSHEPSLSEKHETIHAHLDLATVCELYLREHSNFKTIFSQPTRALLSDMIDRLHTYDISGLRSTIEFRKYLFNYITWLPESKAFKQKVATILDGYELRGAIDEYLGGVSHT